MDHLEWLIGKAIDRNLPGQPMGKVLQAIREAAAEIKQEYELTQRSTGIKI